MKRASIRRNRLYSVPQGRQGNLLAGPARPGGIPLSRHALTTVLAVFFCAVAGDPLHRYPGRGKGGQRIAPPADDPCGGALRGHGHPNRIRRNKKEALDAANSRDGIPLASQPLTSQAASGSHCSSPSSRPMCSSRMPIGYFIVTPLFIVAAFLLL
ncbi:MAG: hypothetical protein MZV63_03525 [Marinilabiliales bacterium]|nr:hypothetical protein [Marinilabiliales bacterium]